MYVLENPVLQRELLVNMRTHRSFVLLFLYQALLALVVYLAWPQEHRLDANAVAARRLVDTFYLGQYILVTLMAPTFAAGAITGEKERKTYEMLLASPLRPGAILLGKLIASLTHLAILILTSLPIVMLCLPLGGVSLYEVLGAYLGLTLSVITFGMISIACSSYFQRTAASLVASYLLILPISLVGILAWQQLGSAGELRLMLVVTLLPAVAVVTSLVLFFKTSARLLNPPDVGSEGKDVVDLDEEADQVVGLVINRDQFPDRLFAPPQRDGLMQDGVNPVYDKEVHSEIFSHGTRMLRLVIQVSMFLAIPIMAVCLFLAPANAAWYVAYVLLFNVLVGPVFSAGSVTSERERQTLDLLLTTTVTPWQILWGKLIAGLRVSSVLTLFLVWPMVLACLMVSAYWRNLVPMLAFLSIILLTCTTTAVIALFHSVLYRSTSASMIMTYVVLIIVFAAPVAAKDFMSTFLPGSTASHVTQIAGTASPFLAAFSVPLEMDWFEIEGDRLSRSRDAMGPAKTWSPYGKYVAITVVINGLLIGIMIGLFRLRWQVSQ